MIRYSTIPPLTERVAADRQGARRHYGVHPYFTRRPFNVVREYLLHYTGEHDAVVDPFGGSGVTAIEAFLENRAGVHNDINPLANFIANGIVNLKNGHLTDYEEALDELRERCERTLAQIAAGERDFENLRTDMELPPDVPLPSNSDVDSYDEMFSETQLASLAVLKKAIGELRDPDARNAMLLAWSATLTKLNRTFLSAEGRAESRGGSSIFSIYRYKIAKKPVELPAWPTFQERAVNVLAAKNEIDRLIDYKRRIGGFTGSFTACAQDVEELAARYTGEVDYVFTDPPYGGHISYLDLSTLWTAWLGIPPDQKAVEAELIVGGEMNFSEDYYVRRLGESIKACVRMLKPERWLSVVFQHWNVAYFEAILTAAAEAGTELRSAVSQVGDPIWSMHKKKGNDSVLAGEMILTFYNSRKPQAVGKNGSFDVSRAVGELLRSRESGRLYGEALFNELIVAAWHKSAIRSLNISRTEFNDLIRSHGWHYDEVGHCWLRDDSERPSFLRV